MNEKFDPMTGEPITGKNEEEVSLNSQEEPMVEEEVNKQEETKDSDSDTGNSKKEIIGYDPMTGEPIYEEDNSKKEIIGYDPMTGEPIYEEDNSKKQIIGYDPMTGEPIYEDVLEPKKKGSKKLGKIVCGVAAAVIVLGVAVVNFGPRIVLGRNAKFMTAAYKTVKQQGELVDVIADMEDKMMGGSYSVNADMSVYNSSITAQFAYDQKKKAASLYGNAQYGGFGSDFQAYMDAKEIQMQIPSLVDRTFLYNYEESSRGYVAEIVRQEMGMDLNMVNDLLDKVWNSKQDTFDNLRGDSFSIIKDEINKLEFEKIENADFKVDGKTRKCKGYEVKLDTDNYYDWIDAAQKLTENYKDSYMEAMTMMGEAYNLDDDFNELRSEAGSIGRCYVRVYLYKGKLAAVELEDYERNMVRLELMGGNYRTQNWRIVNGTTGSVYMEQESSLNNKTEEFLWISGNERLGELAYNLKTGELEIQMGDYQYPELIFDGAFLKKKGQYVVEIDDIQVEDERLDLRGTISFSNKPKIEKPSDGGKVFDIGNASEAEWQLLFQEIYSGKLGNMLEDIL